MKVKCRKGQIHPNPLVLPENPNEPISEYNYVCSGFGDNVIGTILTPLQTYMVYGIIIYKGNTYYLIDNVRDCVKFFPSELFQINDNHLNDDWCIYKYSLLDSKITAIGPPELVGKYDCLVDIMNDKRIIMSAFFKYKSYFQ